MSYRRQWTLMLLSLSIGLLAAVLGITSQVLHVVELVAFTGVFIYTFTLRPDVVSHDLALIAGGIGFVVLGLCGYSLTTLVLGRPMEQTFLLLKSDHGLYANIALIHVAFGYSLCIVGAIRFAAGLFTKNYFRKASFPESAPLKEPEHEFHTSRRTE